MKNIVNIDSLTFEHEGKREYYNYEVAPDALATNMGAKKLGYNISVLPPGQFSAPYHFHHSEEELFLVLDGTATLRLNGVFREIKKGDLIFFAANPEGVHQIHNHSDRPFRYLAISTRDDFEVCEYPDSKKVYVAKIKKVFQGDDAVDYWKGEENPRQFWPPEKLRLKP